MDDVDLFKLKVRDYKLGLYPDDNVSYQESVRQKISRKGIRFQTFFNSEACEIVDLYLKEKESKEGELDENNLLFVTKNKSNGKYIKISRHFPDNLKTACNKLNVNNVTPKSLRRWFKTELSKRRVESVFIKRMMGHAVDVEGTAYEGTFDDSDEFEKEYVENIEQYTLLGNDKKLSKVDKRVETLETELQNMRNEMEKIKSMMQTLDVIKKGEIEVDIWPEGVESGSPNEEPRGSIDKYIEIHSPEGAENVKTIEQIIKEKLENLTKKSEEKPIKDIIDQKETKDKE